jgi:hypothetical protein
MNVMGIVVRTPVQLKQRIAPGASITGEPRSDDTGICDIPFFYLTHGNVS